MSLGHKRRNAIELPSILAHTLQEAPRPHTPRPSHAAIISPAICVQSKRRARLEAEWTGTRVTDDDDNASGDNDRAPAATATHGTGVYGSAQKRPEVDDGVLDQRVSDRMLKRIFTFAGVPVLLGLLLFPGFYYLVVRCCHWCTMCAARSECRWLPRGSHGSCVLPGDSPP